VRKGRLPPREVVRKRKASARWDQRRKPTAREIEFDVSATAREMGIRWPVALTRPVWERCVSVPPGVACQDEAGRLWDLVYLLRFAISRSAGPVVQPVA
jgi:hypothetical protein